MEMKVRKKYLVEEYEINPSTYMLIPYIRENELWTRVVEDDCYVLTPESPIKIINRCCSYNGTDFNGRRNGTKALINVTHKPPILLDPHTSIYIFPTKSPFHQDCIWIVADQVEHYWKQDKSTTLVEFQNKETMEVPVSNYVFKSQISRAAELRVKYERNKQRMVSYLSNPKTRLLYLEASEYNETYDTNN